MPKKIDWMYHRKNCNACKKAHAFLETQECKLGEMVDATKVKYGREEALELAKSASKVITGRGANVVITDMKKAAPDDDALVGLILGPTGNLKAPTLRVGSTLLVGFSEAAYQQFFGG